MPDFHAQRLNMVASQILANEVTDDRVLEAFRQVPRERFVPPQKLALAYADAPIELVHGRWLLEPRTFAKLVQLAEILPSERVLDVGCATGYSTSVLARIARQVVGLDQDAEFLRIATERLRDAGSLNASIVQGPLAEGNRAMGPYDAIVVNGAIEIRPEKLLAQLAEGGRLVAVFQHDAQGHAVVYLNERGRVGRRLAFDASAAVLNAFREPAGFVF